MKFSTALLVSMLAAASCQAGPAPGTAKDDCRAIVSDLERLACFDRAAGTPPSPIPGDAGPAAAPSARPGPPPPAPQIADLVRQNEAGRAAGDFSFLISRVEDALPGQTRVLISAPALDGAAESAFLAISCIANISRLQLLLPRPSERNQIRIRLYIDDRPLSAPRTWQAMEPGNVIDAGRGLVAVDLLRQFSSGGRLRLESDDAAVHGLMFDATGLHGLIAQQREACHW